MTPLELLVELEWSSFAEISDEDDHFETTWIPACPSCRGLKELPATFRIGNKYEGYADAKPSPDHEFEVGHREDCRLDQMIRRSEP